MLPSSEKLGYRAASATPISAVCPASLRSALRTSGRRRSASAGTPTATSAGATGTDFASASTSFSAPGGCPSNTASRYFACSRLVRSAGICARTSSRLALACSSSNCVVSPASCRHRVMS